MRQNEALEKKTLGQKTEDRLMKYILDRPIQIGEKIPNEYALTELFEVRLMIEPEVVTWACKRATEEQIDKAEQLCDEIEKLYNQGVDHIYKDIEFHCFLAKLSGNVVVERLLPVINTAVVTFANITYRSLKNETLTTHRAIVKALRTRDAVGARCAMIMHLTYNRQVI